MWLQSGTAPPLTFATAFCIAHVTFGATDGSASTSAAGDRREADHDGQPVDGGLASLAGEACAGVVSCEHRLTRGVVAAM